MTEAPKWRPIETAPRDGTPILAYENYGDGSIMTVMVGCRGGFNDDGEGWAWNPTHWMPLPEPPDGGRLVKTVVTDAKVENVSIEVSDGGD